MTGEQGAGGNYGSVADAAPIRQKHRITLIDLPSTESDSESATVSNSSAARRIMRPTTHMSNANRVNNSDDIQHLGSAVPIDLIRMTSEPVTESVLRANQRSKMGLNSAMSLTPRPIQIRSHRNNNNTNKYGINSGGGGGGGEGGIRNRRPPATLRRSSALSRTLTNLYQVTHGSQSPYFRPFSPQISSRSLFMNRNTLDPAVPNERTALRGRAKKITAVMKPTKEEEEEESGESSSKYSQSLTAEDSKKAVGELDGDKTGAQSVDDCKTMSVWNAGFSIINLFLGLGLLSFPYALKEGSFVGLIALAFICIAMSYTGKLIVRCFLSVPKNQRTYPEVGMAALGYFGISFVTFGVLLEFFGALCMSLIFIWDNILYLFGDLLPMWQIVLLSGVVLLPTCWILSFAELWIQSFLGCVCKVCMVLAVIASFFVDTSVTERSTYDFYPTSASSFSISAGIFILSYAGHACLPAIYTSMREPEKFENLLDISFFIMFVTYSSFALFGYLQYGRNTQVIITDNLNAETSFARIAVAKILIVLVILSIYFQVSPILGVVAEIPELLLSIHTPRKQRAFRSLLFLLAVLVSYVLVEHLAILEAITGSLCTMITSAICPAIFYLALNTKSVSTLERVVLITYAVGGVICGIYLVYQDITAVLNGEQ